MNKKKVLKKMLNTSSRHFSLFFVTWVVNFVNVCHYISIIFYNAQPKYIGNLTRQIPRLKYTIWIDTVLIALMIRLHGTLGKIQFAKIEISSNKRRKAPIKTFLSAICLNVGYPILLLTMQILLTLQGSVIYMPSA